MLATRDLLQLHKVRIYTPGRSVAFFCYPVWIRGESDPDSTLLPGLLWRVAVQGLWGTQAAGIGYTGMGCLVRRSEKV